MGYDVPLQTIAEQCLNDGTTGVRYVYIQVLRIFHSATHHFKRSL